MGTSPYMPPTVEINILSGKRCFGWGYLPDPNHEKVATVSQQLVVHNRDRIKTRTSL